MILQQHLQLADILRARLTAAIVAQPIDPSPRIAIRGRATADAAAPTPHARIVELKRQIRIAEHCRAAVPSISAAPWSPIHAWVRALRSPHERRLRRLKKQLAALRREHRIPEPKIWKPRPATAADRRIARQYHDVNATGMLWRVTKSGRYIVNRSA